MINVFPLKTNFFIILQQFQWWQSGNRKPYASTLYVTLKGITPPDTVEPAERSLFATQAVSIEWHVYTVKPV